jgi:4-hydroxy-3-methylbut-2-en-1-yl diphosphate reductase
MTIPVLIGPVFMVDRTRPAQVVMPTEIRGRGAVLRCPAAPLIEAEMRRLGFVVAAGAIVLDPHDSGPAMARGRAWPDMTAHADTVVGFGVVGNDERVDRLVRQVAADVADACRPRTIVLAAPRSFCAGVERAVEIVERALTVAEPPVFVRKQIVHNATVIDDLASRGVVFVEELEDVPDGATVVFSAHGVAPAVRAEAERRELRVIDATCPLVNKVHAEARRFSARGDTVVLIGQPGHEEVEGTTGEAPEQIVVIKSAREVASLDVPDPRRVSYLTQTTLAVDETADVIAALRDRFPEARGPADGDICYAATNRQAAVRALVSEVQLVLVVGSANSANSQHLVELAERLGVPARLIDSCRDVRPAWLSGVDVIGVTAGASAPPSLVDELIDALGGLGRITVRERVTAEESTHFNLPAIGGTR